MKKAGPKDAEKLVSNKEKTQKKGEKGKN